MSFDFTRKEDRAEFVKLVKGHENEQRKQRSQRQCRIYQGHLDQYVYEKLRQWFKPRTVKQIPRVSYINIAERVIKDCATIYKRDPVRTFLNASDDLAEDLRMLYKRMFINQRMRVSNQYYKLQDQNHIQPVLVNGEIELRVYKQHLLDAVENEMNPEKADAYSISAFDDDNFLYDPFNVTPTSRIGVSESFRTNTSNRINERIADQDDDKALKERYVVWTPELNFIMNGKGEVISEDDSNPLGEIPIIDISAYKDFKYFIETNFSTTEFSVMYNAMMSSHMHVLKYNGFAQAVIKGPPGMFEDEIEIGVDNALYLPTDPNNPTEVDYSFVSPSADINGSLESMKMNLSNFLSSRGIDSNIISGTPSATAYGSATERLIANMEKFEQTQDDFSLYERVEQRLFSVIKNMINTYQDSGLLNPAYRIGKIPDDVEISVEFARPQLLETDQERIEKLRNKQELGIASRIDAIMEYYDVSRDEAEEMAVRIDMEEGMLSGQTNPIEGAQPFGDESDS